MVKNSSGHPSNVLGADSRRRFPISVFGRSVWPLFLPPVSDLDVASRRGERGFSCSRGRVDHDIVCAAEAAGGVGSIDKTPNIVANDLRSNVKREAGATAPGEHDADPWIQAPVARGRTLTAAF